MSDSEDSEFVLIDPDDASVRPISKPAEEIANLRGRLYPTAYLRDTSEFKKHLNSHIPGIEECIYQIPSFGSGSTPRRTAALWIKAVGQEKAF
ncbi:LOW QUALITY PROTEIN: ankyrin repeat-containing protein [Aspergillus udagawae]|uniref:Ankyrin repeat-containing protein n=1 Tax=Aspergillus udagawae TaxID=91492 RepID=A0A8H3RTZ7_9EURO|nr:LOW QUALITY PROTEIN: ankyrin repeat-containing protein [Aspergillus udagawae]